MAVLLSELYGKQIITNSGQIVGMVEDVIVDFESGAVSSLLLVKMDELVRTKQSPGTLSRNSVKYDRVKSISQSIIVSAGDRAK